MAALPPTQRPPPALDEVVLCALVSSLGPSVSKPQPSKSVKCLENIQEVVLPTTPARTKALPLYERGMVGQFTRLWPSPRVMEIWFQNNWQFLIKGRMTHYFYGRGLYTFLFETKAIET
jgi:hypothetical protein